MQDIVILVQEKNLLSEMQKRKNFTKVGEIERRLDWPIRIRSKYGPLDAKDYYSRKLRHEIDEHNAEAAGPGRRDDQVAHCVVENPLAPGGQELYIR